QIIPPLYHVGTPRHFHSSTTSGIASLISARILASASPRQSPSSAMRWSIRSDGLFARSSLAMPSLPSGFPPWYRRRLANPVGELRRVDRRVLGDMQIARVGILRPHRRQRVELRAPQKGHFDISGEAVITQE